MESKKPVLNLDRLAARYGQTVIQKLADGKNEKKVKPRDADNSITKALGVLQENGVYACFLYLLAKEKENGEVIVGEMLNLLQDIGLWGKADVSSAEKKLSYIADKVAAELEPLLLAKETLEKMLIYARYGAKARTKE